MMTCLPLFMAGDADDAVKMIRRHDLDGVHVFFFVQQLAEIGIGRAALERAARILVCVVRFDKVLRYIAASGDGSLGSRHPFGLTEDRPQFIEKIIRSPVPVSDRML